MAEARLTWAAGFIIYLVKGILNTAVQKVNFRIWKEREGKIGQMPLQLLYYSLMGKNFHERKRPTDQ